MVVGGLADSGLVLRLTRSRGWIGVLGALLVGIVALNVMALSFNASSSKTAGISDELRRENSALRAQIADGLSNEHLQKAAVRLGLIMPEAAHALMLTPGSNDAEIAARRLRDGDFTIGTAYVPPVAPVETAVAEVPVDPAVPAVPDSAAPVDPATLATVAPTDTAPPADAAGGVAP